MKHISIVIACTAIATITALPLRADSSDFHPPHIPSTASTVAKFIPSQWHRFASSSADLDGDGLKDHVIVIAKDGEQSYGSEADLSPRGLIIIMQEPGGKLRKALENWNVIMASGAGGGGRGEAFQGLKASKGKIIIDQEGGDSGVWSFRYTFGMLNGNWTLIGATNGEHSNGLDKITSSDFDWNLLTGRAHYTWNQNNMGADETETDKSSAEPPDQDEWFYIVAVPRTIKRTYSRPVTLKQKSSVTTGQANWRGVQDLSAVVSAGAVDSILTIRANVTDDHVTARDTIKLVDRKGSVITAKTSKFVAAPAGYTQECTYDLTKLFGAQDVTSDVFVAASVEVWDYDAGNKVHCVMSTSDGGRRYAGELTLTKDPLLLKLSDFSEGLFPISLLEPLLQSRAQSN